jgi:hypothetical protein
MFALLALQLASWLQQPHMHVDRFAHLCSETAELITRNGARLTPANSALPNTCLDIILGFSCEPIMLT